MRVCKRVGSINDTETSIKKRDPFLLFIESGEREKESVQEDFCCSFLSGVTISSRETEFDTKREKGAEISVMCLYFLIPKHGDNWITG